MATAQDVRQSAEDFLRFYLQGGAAAARAGTTLVDTTSAAMQAALQAFDQSPTLDAVATIEPTPEEVFVRTPGIARRIPAVVGPAPDFIPCPNEELDRQIFSRPPNVPSDPLTDGLLGPIPIEDPSRPIQPDDRFVDMCAMEDAVVVAAADGTLEVSFLWVQDYPGEEVDSGLPESQLPPVRPVVDRAQPSVIVAECMEALESFLGPEVFQEIKVRSQLQLCSFEALDATRQAVLPGLGSYRRRHVQDHRHAGDVRDAPSLL
jgi:hypothetical protein